MNLKALASFVLFGLLFSSAIAKDLYDHNKSHIMLVTNLNFQKQIQKNREITKNVQILHFYKRNDGSSPKLVEELENFANEYKGVFKVGAVNCNTENAICEKEEIKTFPTVRVYPPLPIPSFDIELPVSELNTQAFMKAAQRYIQDLSIEITAANADTFVKEHPAVPKVLLFTDKKGTPLIYKALSVALEGKQFLGIVRNTEELIVRKYNVQKFPTIILLTNFEKKPVVYKGEMKFGPIFDFLNVYSQTFVPGGSSESSASKSWLTEIVPELHLKSNRDICLGQEGILCVVLFSQGKPEQGIIDTLKKLNVAYDRKIERGLQYKFMWLNCQEEQKWATFFNCQAQSKIVIINPGKRKRVLEHEGELSFESIQSTFEKIIGGDAKFKRLADSDIPEFSAVRKDI